MYTPVVAALGYVMSLDRTRVLLVHRNARADDDHLGKYNGLGGKIEADEDVATAMRRELREEAGIEVTSMRLRGTMNWPGFGTDGSSWLGFIFMIDSFTGEVPASNDEGDLSWELISELDQLPMWEGDRHFLRLVFDETVEQFHGVMAYDNRRLVNWSVSVS